MVRLVTPQLNFIPIEVNPAVFPLPGPMVIVVPGFGIKVSLVSFSHFLACELIFFVAEAGVKFAPCICWVVKKIVKIITDLFMKFVSYIVKLPPLFYILHFFALGMD